MSLCPLEGLGTCDELDVLVLELVVTDDAVLNEGTVVVVTFWVVVLEAGPLGSAMVLSEEERVGGTIGSISVFVGPCGTAPVASAAPSAALFDLPNDEPGAVPGLGWPDMATLPAEPEVTAAGATEGSALRLVTSVSDADC